MQVKYKESFLMTVGISIGGHDVPEADQERRFGKSLSNFSNLLLLADETFVYRNDFEIGHERIAEYQLGKCIWIEQNALLWLPR